MYWLTGILGVFLLLAPFIFNYGDNIAASWTSMLSGSLIVIASILERLQKDTADWEYWASGMIGAFAIVSPFVLGFNTHSVAMLTTMILGIMIVLLTGSRLLMGEEDRGRSI